MKCLKRIDELALKPYFIHKYEKERMKLEDQYLDLFMKEGDRWEKGFVRQEINRSRTKRESFAGSRGNLKGIDVGKIKKKINENAAVDMSSPTDLPDQEKGSKIQKQEYDDMFGDK